MKYAQYSLIMSVLNCILNSDISKEDLRVIYFIMDYAQKPTAKFSVNEEQIAMKMHVDDVGLEVNAAGEPFFDYDKDKEVIQLRQKAVSKSVERLVSAQILVKHGFDTYSLSDFNNI